MSENRDKIITREMVAERAGVCKQTVSCYFSGKRGVSPRTAERIERAIKELNYVPNMIARSLVKKESHALAIICNDISNPSYSEIISGIERAAQRKRYAVTIYNAKNFSPATITDIVSRRIDGVILLTFKKTIGEENFSRLEASGVKVIVTHSAGEKLKSYMQLEPNFFTGIDSTVLRLKELGHTDIMMLSSFPYSSVVDMRLGAFIKSFEGHFGRSAQYLACDSVMASNLETGEKLAEQFLEKGCTATAVLTTNDLMAIGAMRVFAKHKKRVAVVGIDNTVFAEYVTPSLSSIGYDKEKYGTLLFEMFLESKNNTPPRYEVVPTYLIERESIFENNSGI